MGSEVLSVRCHYGFGHTAYSGDAGALESVPVSAGSGRSILLRSHRRFGLAAPERLRAQMRDPLSSASSPVPDLPKDSASASALGRSVDAFHQRLRSDGLAVSP